MPVDICWATDQVPEEQRWKEVPEMQFHWPSVLQLPVRAAELELELEADSEPDEEVVTGAGAAAEEDVGSGSVSAGELDGVASGTGAADTVAGAVEALSAGAEEEAGEAEPDELEPESEPELEELEVVSPEPPKVAVPVQASEPSFARLAASPSYSTMSPG